MDITDIILRQHAEQRQTFAYLDDMRQASSEQLAAVWGRLEVLLEVHAEAEERHFYPRLLQVGKGAADAKGVEDEVQDAVKDHNEIRDAVREVGKHQPGSADWWQAVAQARIANSDHMAEEERQDLQDFREHADLSVRHELAVAFLAYEGSHAMGIKPQNDDPKAYVREHSG